MIIKAVLVDETVFEGSKAGPVDEKIFLSILQGNLEVVLVDVLLVYPLEDVVN